jgi:peptide/nickel transport system substrate-binding protein
MLAMLAACRMAFAAPPAVAAPQNCGTVVIPLGINVDSLSPMFAESAIDEEAYSMMYLNLLWIDSSDKIDWSRSLASAVDTTDDQTFTITSHGL